MMGGATLLLSGATLWQIYRDARRSPALGALLVVSALVAAGTPFAVSGQAAAEPEPSLCVGLESSCRGPQGPPGPPGAGILMAHASFGPASVTTSCKSLGNVTLEVQGRAASSSRPRPP